MRFLIAAALVLVASARSPTANACLGHFRSVESLVKSARSIVEVEVVSVTDVRPKGDGAAHRGAKDGRALVQLVRSLRGSAAPQRFVVEGGPYASCAPFAQYVQFKAGQRFILIVPSRLSGQNSPVVVKHTEQIFTGGAAEIERMIGEARMDWQRTFDLYNKADAGAYSKAESLVRLLGEPGTAALAAKAPYPVKACLNALAKDPERMPPGWVESLGITFSGLPLSKRAVEVGTRRGPEIFAFNKRLLGILLLERYGLTKPEMETIVDAACVREQLEDPTFNPDSVRFGCEERPDLQALSLLQVIDRFEPDSRVFRAFDDPTKLDADGALVARYLDWKPDRALDRRTIGLVLKINHADLEPFADKAAARIREDYEFVDLFGFFVGIGRLDKARTALDGVRKALDRIKDKSWRASSAEIHAKDLTMLMQQHGCDDADLLKSIAQMGGQAQPGRRRH